MLTEQFPNFKSFVVWHVAESKKKSGQSGLSCLSVDCGDDEVRNIRMASLYGLTRERL